MTRVGICLLVAAVLLVSCDKGKSQKTGYVELGKIVEGFELKRTLQDNLLALKNSRTNEVDSLQLELQILSRQIKASNLKDKKAMAEFEIKKEIFINKKDQYSRQIDSLSQVYDSRIMQQLNQYIKDFGIENNYKYIFGAEGSGALMYADTSENITIVVTKYISEKYSGKK